MSAALGLITWAMIDLLTGAIVTAVVFAAASCMRMAFRDR